MISVSNSSLTASVNEQEAAVNIALGLSLASAAKGQRRGHGSSNSGGGNEESEDLGHLEYYIIVFEKAVDGSIADQVDSDVVVVVDRDLPDIRLDDPFL